MTTLLLLLCTFMNRALRAQDLAPRLTQYAHQAWRLRDGAFVGTPNTLAQTADGYLWIGTSAGLVRFDGVHFTPWKDPDQVSTRGFSVYSLLASEDGRLWVGTGRTLAQLENNHLRTIHQGGRVNGIVQDPTGDLWFAVTRFESGRGPLCRKDHLGVHCFGSSEKLDCPYGSSLSKGFDHSLWMGSYPGACQWTPTGSFAYLPKGMHQGDISAAVDAVLDLGGGKALIGFNGVGDGLGLELLRDGRFHSFDVPGLIGSHLKVTVLFQTASGEIWIGTADDGIYRIAGGKADHFGAADGLSSEEISGIIEDRESNIWVSTVSGIDQFHRLAMTSYSTREGMISNTAESVTRLQDGSISAAARRGLNFFKHGDLVSVPVPNHPPHLAATSQMLDHKGTLWVGVDNRLSTFRDGTFHWVDLPDGSSIGQVTDIVEDSDKNVWIVASKGRSKLFRFAGNQLQEIPLPSSSRIWHIAPDTTHGILLGSSQADLYRIDQGHTEPLTTNNRDTTIRAFRTDASGSIWAWGPAGVYHLADHHWALLNSRKGLPCDTVLSMLDDGKGFDWIYLSCGLAKLRTAELQRWSKSPDTNVEISDFYDAADGAYATDTPFSPQNAIDATGRLWFAGDGALQSLDPHSVPFNAVIPPVHIESVTANRNPYALSDMLTLPKHTHDVAIDYTALSLVAPQKVRFRYQLSGVDHGWQDVGPRRQAFYTNLSPGRYVFHVTACNNSGVWNPDGTELTFIIPPAFYQTTWFEILVIAAICAAIWLAIRRRIHAATAQVEAREIERVAERDRIARELHDTLIQGVQGIILSVHAVIHEVSGNEEPKQKMSAVLNQAEGLLMEGRNRIRDLRSQTIGSADLVLPIEDLIGVQSNSEPQVSLEVQGVPRFVELAVRDEIVLFAREAISNAVRHARSSAIRCTLSFSKTKVSFTCNDNGIGIDPILLATRQQDGHSGLLGMKERAATVGGTMDIQNSPDGLTVTLSVPGYRAFSEQKSVGLLRRLVERWKQLVTPSISE